MVQLTGRISELEENMSLDPSSPIHTPDIVKVMNKSIDLSEEQHDDMKLSEVRLSFPYTADRYVCRVQKCYQHWNMTYRH